MVGERIDRGDGPGPTIPWICTDQHRFDALGCYGNEFVSTPNLDAPVSQGHAVRTGVLSEPRLHSESLELPDGPLSPRDGLSPERPVDPRVGSARDEAAVGRGVRGLAGKLHLSACSPTVTPNTERRIDDGYHVFDCAHDANPWWPTSSYHRWFEEQGVTYGTTALPDTDVVVQGMPAEYPLTTWAVDRAINFIESCADHNAPWLFSFEHLRSALALRYSP